MNVGVQLSVAVCTPANPAQMVSPSSPTPMAPAATSVAGLTSVNESHSGTRRTSS